VKLVTFGNITVRLEDVLAVSLIKEHAIVDVIIKGWPHWLSTEFGSVEEAESAVRSVVEAMAQI